MTAGTRRARSSSTRPAAILLPRHAQWPRLRYGIGVGRPGFDWAGVKQRHPQGRMAGLAPPAEMLKRRPDLPTFMKGGPGESAGRARHVSGLVALPHPRHQRALDRSARTSRPGCIRMMQRGRDRPLPARARGNARRRDLKRIGRQKAGRACNVRQTGRRPRKQDGRPGSPGGRFRLRRLPSSRRNHRCRRRNPRRSRPSRDRPREHRPRRCACPGPRSIPRAAAVRGRAASRQPAARAARRLASLGARIPSGLESLKSPLSELASSMPPATPAAAPSAPLRNEPPPPACCRGSAVAERLALLRPPPARRRHVRHADPAGGAGRGLCGRWLLREKDCGEPAEGTLPRVTGRGADSPPKSDLPMPPRKLEGVSWRARSRVLLEFGDARVEFVEPRRGRLQRLFLDDDGLRQHDRRRAAPAAPVRR